MYILIYICLRKISNFYILFPSNFYKIPLILNPILEFLNNKSLKIV